MIAVGAGVQELASGSAPRWLIALLVAVFLVVLRLGEAGETP